MLRPFVRFDAWLQRRFDAVVHEIMRRTGASKRTLRRMGWCAAVGALVLRSGTGGAAYGSLPINWIGIVVYGSHLFMDDWSDMVAERRRCVSIADTLGNFRKLGGCVLIAASLALIMPSSLSTTCKTFDLLFGLAFLFQGYLCGTSPQAPKKQPRQARAWFGQLVRS